MCDHYDNYFKDEPKTSSKKNTPVDKQQLPIKKFRVKENFRVATNAILGYSTLKLTEDSAAYIRLKECKVLDIFCEEIVEEWKEPEVVFNTNLENYPSFSTLKKATLLIRMQSWADFYNKQDGWVADWSNWGIIIAHKKSYTDYYNSVNGLLFQITVGTEARAKQMHEKFNNEIQELIQMGVI